MKVNEEKDAGVQRDETGELGKAAHTPGTWSCGDTWMVKAGPITISQDWNGIVKHQELRANARLIAAAPELLEVCQLEQWFWRTASECDECTLDLCTVHTVEYQNLCNKRCAAIAKATGEQQ